MKASVALAVFFCMLFCANRCLPRHCLGWIAYITLLFVVVQTIDLPPLRQVPVRCPLRARLAVILSALIRFNLRVMLNPPPPTYSVPGFCAVQKTGLKQSKVIFSFPLFFARTFIL